MVERSRLGQQTRLLGAKPLPYAYCVELSRLSPHHPGKSFTTTSNNSLLLSTIKITLDPR